MNKTLINFLINLKNSSLIGTEIVSVSHTKSIEALSILFYKLGMIQSFNINKSTNSVVLNLRYFYGKNSFRNLKILSSPSKAIYLTYFDLCKIAKKKDILVLSTSLGYLTGSECKKLKIGGKVCFIC
jgi:ribosomal protein S8